MESIVESINGIIWSNALIFMCLGAGLWFSVRTRFMQIRGFAEMCRLTIRGEKKFEQEKGDEKTNYHFVERG